VPSVDDMKSRAQDAASVWNKMNAQVKDEKVWYVQSEINSGSISKRHNTTAIKANSKEEALEKFKKERPNDKVIKVENGSI
jgi:hypothetical protein